MDAPWDLSPHIDRLIAFRDAREWNQFHRPKELAAAIAIEAAELQELFVWRDDETASDVAGDSDRMARVRDEIADVVVFAVYLAHDLGIDLSNAIGDKIEANERKYSPDRWRGHVS